MKKALSILLALIIALGCITVAFAEEKETDKLKVEIKTDKDKYRVSDEIIFNIKVTNVSDETLKVVDLSTASDDLLIIKGPITEFEDELAPGESIEITFRARPFFVSENLGFFEKTTASICSLPYFVNVWYCLWRFWTMWALNPGYDYGVVYNEAPVKVGDSELILRVRASYSIGEHVFEDFADETDEALLEDCIIWKVEFSKDRYNIFDTATATVTMTNNSQKTLINTSAEVTPYNCIADAHIVDFGVVPAGESRSITCNFMIAPGAPKLNFFSKNFLLIKSYFFPEMSIRYSLNSVQYERYSKPKSVYNDYVEFNNYGKVQVVCNAYYDILEVSSED